MYEHTKDYHLELSDLLAHQVSSKVFPQSSLWYGNRYQGRMTLALETARVLSCKKSGEFSCTCSSCSAFHTLETSHLIVIGSRDYSVPIEAAFHNYHTHQNTWAKNNLIRTIRMMLLQYHGAFLGSSESKNDVYEAASQVQEMVIEYALDRIDIESLRKSVKPLVGQNKKSSVLTIGQIRNIQEWISKTTVESTARFVIIEGVEYCAEGAKNSLLKLLEEPPSDTYLMIITEHPSRILPTILSRVRQYHVPQLSAQLTQTLLSQQFYVQGHQYATLEDYFLDCANIPYKTIQTYAHDVAYTLLQKEELSRSYVEKLCDELDRGVSYEYFLKMVAQEVSSWYRAHRVQEPLVQKIVHLLSESAFESEIFNQSKKVFIESLYYRLQEME